MRSWLALFASHILLAAVRSFTGFCEEERCYGDMNTCSGMVTKVVGASRRVFKEDFGLELRARHLFGAEIVPDRLAFCHDFTDIELLYLDNCDLLLPEAPVYKRLGKHLVPYSEVLGSGFTCVSRSSRNVSSKDHKGCVEKASAKTGESYDVVRQRIDLSRPASVFLENLIKLMESNSGVVGCRHESDAAYIVWTLEQMGYCAQWYPIRAEEYGSFVDRLRIFLVAFLGGDNRWKLQFIERRLSKMKVDRFPGFRFMLTVDCLEDMGAMPPLLPDISEEVAPQQARPTKKAKTDGNVAAYLDDHILYFEEAGLPWPAPLHDPCMRRIKGRVTERTAEVIYFINAKFPVDLALETYQFFNANDSVPQLCPRAQGTSEMKNPWLEFPGTIISSTQLVVRYFEGKGDTKQLTQ